MSHRTLSPEALRTTIAAAITGALACNTGGGAGTGDSNDGPSAGLKACVAEGEHGYPGSGIEQCNQLFLHRARALECHPELLRPGAAGYPESRSNAAPNSDCYTDDDCRSLPGGYCVLQDTRLLCVYGCRDDGDCNSDQLCLCGSELAGKCVAAECRTDADCADGSLCTGPADLGEEIPVHFSCQQARDECAGDLQCGNGLYCHFDPAEGHKLCHGHEPAPGRPFLVQGEARTAPVSESAEWLPADAAPAGAGSLTASERARVVEYWVRAAQMEHASVAAFARFSLQLLQLGAPARLLGEAAVAQADEIRHAEAAFRVASYFHGAPLAPGRLSLHGVSLSEDLDSILENTIIEGCVGETLAALEASEALARAEHPQVRAALESVAEDEARHAALAWSFVAWALARYGEGLIATVDAAFERALTQSASASSIAERHSAGQTLVGFGVPSPGDAALRRSEAWRTVIQPCRAQLAAVHERATTALPVPSIRAQRATHRSGTATAVR